MPTVPARLVAAIDSLAKATADRNPAVLDEPVVLATRCGASLLRALAGDPEMTDEVPIDAVHAAADDLADLDLEPAIQQLAGCVAKATIAHGRLHLPLEERHRKRAGAFYTPPALVACTLDHTLTPWIDTAGEAIPDVLDPACGTGRFLRETGDRLVNHIMATDRTSREDAWRIVGPHLHGVDTDPLATAWLRARLVSLAGGDRSACSGIRTADALAEETLEPERFDIVVGNPPFGTALHRNSGVEADRRLLRDRFGPVIQAYTDRAAMFLLLACWATRPGGRIGLVLPLSMLTARDAYGVRAFLLEHAVPTAGWASPRSVFDAQVHACMIAMHRREPDSMTTTSRLVDLPAREIDAISSPRDPDTWACLAAPAIGLPDLPEFEHRSTLAEIATATADFRDQYYGLRGAIAERADATGGMPILTVGLVDPARCAWSHRPARLLGRAWSAPVVHRDRLDESMQGWFDARREPKVVLPTQTRVLEPLLDADGRWLPSVPLISITPHDTGDLQRVAALLACPLISLLAMHRHLGAARHPQAIKLAARDVVALPLPADARAWDEAAEAFARAQGADTGANWLKHLRACGEHGLRAFEVEAGAAQAVLAWWDRRLPKP